MLRIGMPALLTVCLLLSSIFSITQRNSFVTGSGEAELTGISADQGIDTDSNSKYDYLEAVVGVDASVAGNYRIEASCLVNPYGSMLYIFASNETHLNSGSQEVDLLFFGPAIYGDRFDPANISLIELYVERMGSSQFVDSLTSVPLSRVYNHTEFDSAAVLTGRIYDQGVDSDADGLFDYLQLSIEVQVLENASYMVHVEELWGDGMYFSVYRSATSFLTVGNQTINVMVYGPQLFRSLHGAHGSVSQVARMSLSIGDNSEFYSIDSKSYVPLSTEYAYDQFESHAFFTGSIFDNGVDEDADGLFEYLNVGVEVNVTEAGNYTISVYGLKGIGLNGTLEIYDPHRSYLELSKATHTVNFTFSGPMIAYEHLNPTSVTDLPLEENTPDYFLLDYVDAAELPAKCNYTQFNSPLEDVELNFEVCPNATVNVNGNITQTRMYPVQDDPKVNATLSFSTIGDLTTGHANGSILLPEASEWPFNSTTASFLADYHNDALNAQLNALVRMPPVAATSCPVNSSAGDVAFTARYADGLGTVNIYGILALCPDYASQMPFNVSDATMLLDYLNGEIAGNLTLHTIGGFPLGDVIVNIHGNKTDFLLSGYVNVTYGSFFGVEINETIVGSLIDMLGNYTGQGDGSLYNMTNGAVEFASLDTVRTPHSVGELVEYNATLQGNFTRALARLVSQSIWWGSDERESSVYGALDAAFSSVQNASLQLNYYLSGMVEFDLTLHADVKELWVDALELIPVTVPLEERTMVEAWLKIANATAYAIETARVDAFYSGDEQQLNLTASLTANVTQLKNDTIPFIPSAGPPELQEAFESYLNVTYCELSSLTVSGNLTSGVLEFEADWMLEGGFKEQANHAKAFMIELLNFTDPESVGWELFFFNSTTIDVSNFQIESAAGEGWTTVAFRGLRMYPTADQLDFIRFKLGQWLNGTNYPDAPPREFEKLKITFTAGFNGTHTVLLYAPGTVLQPDAIGLDYKMMMWENVSMSELKDVLFQIAFQGVVNHAGKTYYVPIFTNSTASDFSFDSGLKCLSFSASGADGVGFCNMTVPRALLYASPEDWIVRVDGEQVGYNVTENSGYVFIYVDYSHSSHTIEVFGTWVVTEYQPNLLPLVLMALCLAAAVVAVTQRRRFSAAKVKYQAAIHAIMLKIYRDML